MEGAWEKAKEVGPGETTSPPEREGNHPSQPLSLPLRLSEQQVTIPGDPAKNRVFTSWVISTLASGDLLEGLKGKRRGAHPPTLAHGC